MSKAVQFDSYGGIDVLEVRDVPRPVPGAGEVLVQVRVAGINPSEGVIRSGALHHLFPATFPSGQGSDLAGVVAELCCKKVPVTKPATFNAARKCSLIAQRISRLG